MSMREWRPSIAHGDTTLNNIHEFTVPDQERWHVMSVFCAFTTSNAGNATRQMRLAAYTSTVAEGGAASDCFFEVRPGLTQDSELTYHYAFYPGAADITSIRDSVYCSIPIPATLVLNPGWTIVLEEMDSNDTDADDLESNILYQMSRVPSTSLT